jgi:hypothetical protein
MSNTVEFEMSDELGMTVTQPSDSLPSAPPELCGAELQPAGDRRITIGRAGSLICYFRSPAATLATCDVLIDVAGDVLRSHAISSLGDGLWQANILLDQHRERESVRLRLGNGPWSKTLPVRRIHS